MSAVDLGIITATKGVTPGASPEENGGRLEIRRLMTLHAPLGRGLSGPLLDALGEKLREQGIDQWWISHEALPDIVIMAEMPAELGHIGTYAGPTLPQQQQSRSTASQTPRQRYK